MEIAPRLGPYVAMSIALLVLAPIQLTATPSP